MPLLTRTMIVTSKSSYIDGCEVKLAQAHHETIEGQQILVQDSPGAWMNVPVTTEEASGFDVGAGVTVTFEAVA